MKLTQGKTEIAVAVGPVTPISNLKCRKPCSQKALEIGDLSTPKRHSNSSESNQSINPIEKLTFMKSTVLSVLNELDEMINDFTPEKNSIGTQTPPILESKKSTKKKSSLLEVPDFEDSFFNIPISPKVKKKQKPEINLSELQQKIDYLDKFLCNIEEDLSSLL